MKIYRYEVPVDDQPHTFKLTKGDLGRVRYVAGNLFTVEFWAEHWDGVPEGEVTFRVFGTGMEIPAEAQYAGTAPRTREGLVWHLYEMSRK